MFLCHKLMNVCSKLMKSGLILFLLLFFCLGARLFILARQGPPLFDTSSILLDLQPSLFHLNHLCSPSHQTTHVCTPKPEVPRGVLGGQHQHYQSPQGFFLAGVITALLLPPRLTSFPVALLAPTTGGPTARNHFVLFFGCLSFCSCGRGFNGRMPFLAPTFSVREGLLAFGQPRPIHKAVHPFFSPLTIRRESGGCILHSPATGNFCLI